MTTPLGAARAITKIPAQDLGRARRFYRDRLGLEPVEERTGGLDMPGFDVTDEIVVARNGIILTLARLARIALGNDPTHLRSFTRPWPTCASVNAPGEEMMTPQQAGEMIGVRPLVLEAWHQRFGFPRPVTLHGQPAYLTKELVALRQALRTAPSIPSAIDTARRRIGRDR